MGIVKGKCGQMFLLITNGSFDTYPNELKYRFNVHLAGLISHNHIINYDVVEIYYQLSVSKNLSTPIYLKILKLFIY